MKTRNHPVHDCHGSILATAVVIGGVLLIALVAALSLSSSHNETTVRSGAWNKALVVAEAGVEEALAQLNNSSSTWNGNGWTLSGGQYSKQRSLGSDSYLVTVTANATVPVIVSTASVFLPAKSNRLSRAVRVNARRTASMRGMIALGDVNVGGGSSTDSYDSSDPAHSTGGLYDPAKAKENGNVGTIATTASAFTIAGAAFINGKIFTGASGVLAIGGSASAGSFAWTADAANKGKVQPGWLTTDATASYTNINFPTSAGTFGPSSGIVGGTNYTYVLGSEKYQLTSLKLDSYKTVLVTGNATLIIDDTLIVEAFGSIQIAPDASLTLYVGKQASIKGQGILNGTGLSSKFTCYGGPACTSIYYAGKSALTGTFYAPSASMVLEGDNDFYGASVCKTLSLAGGFDFHYDEALAKDSMLYIGSSWDEL